MSKRNDAIEIYAIKAFCERFNASVQQLPLKNIFNSDETKK